VIGADARVMVATTAPGSRRVAVAAAGCAALAIVGVFDPTRTTLGPPCPLRTLTGLDCPLCGATRATHALLRAHFADAVDFNALYVIALPLAAVVAIAWLVSGRRPAWVTNPRAVWVVLGVAALFAVVRNLPFAPFAVLGSAVTRQ